MIAWLLAFVVVPSGILFIYSFGRRGVETPVELAFSWSNYARVFSGTEIAPLLRTIMTSAIAALLVMAAAYLFLASDSRWPRLRRLGLSVFGGLLILNVWLDLQSVFSGPFIRILVRSIYYAGATTLLCLSFGYPAAYFIGRAPERCRNRLLMLVMVPFWTSFIVRTYAWITILSENGLLNGLLEACQLLSRPVTMLYTPGAVVLGLVYSYLPFMILPIYGSVERLSQFQLEAASDLGANPLQVFRSVILPQTRPGVVAGALLVFVPSIGMFAVTDLMGGKTFPMIGNVIQSQFAGQGRDWPFGAALGITMLLLFALSFCLAARFRLQEQSR